MGVGVGGSRPQSQVQRLTTLKDPAGFITRVVGWPPSVLPALPRPRDTLGLGPLEVVGPAALPPLLAAAGSEARRVLASSGDSRAVCGLQ